MGTGILVFVETENGAPRRSGLELLGKAQGLAAAIGGSVSAAVIGSADTTVLGNYGAQTVYVADAGGWSSSGRNTAALEALVQAANPAVVLAAASNLAKDVFPRLSARLNAGLAAECTDLRAEGGKVVGRRPIYAGKVLADVRVNSALGLYTVRPNSFPVGAPAGGSASVQSVAVNAANELTLVETLAPAGKEVDLTEADRIVSGGRSLGSKEKFDAVIRPLARSIKATPGASRAAVDAGYAPHGAQVGETGKVVNPSLYIALGISGAIQHLAGMRTSKVIVAVNKDPEAPIFAHASYGIVGDLFVVAPLLQQAFERLN